MTKEEAIKLKEGLKKEINEVMGNAERKDKQKNIYELDIDRIKKIEKKDNLENLIKKDESNDGSSLLDLSAIENLEKKDNLENLIKKVETNVGLKLFDLFYIVDNLDIDEIVKNGFEQTYNNEKKKLSKEREKITDYLEDKVAFYLIDNDTNGKEKIERINDPFSAYKEISTVELMGLYEVDKKYNFFEAVKNFYINNNDNNLETRIIKIPESATKIKKSIDVEKKYAIFIENIQKYIAENELGLTHVYQGATLINNGADIEIYDMNKDLYFPVKSKVNGTIKHEMMHAISGFISKKIVSLSNNNDLYVGFYNLFQIVLKNDLKDEVNKMFKENLQLLISAEENVKSKKLSKNIDAPYNALIGHSEYSDGNAREFVAEANNGSLSYYPIALERWLKKWFPEKLDCNNRYYKKLEEYILTQIDKWIDKDKLTKNVKRKIERSVNDKKEYINLVYGLIKDKVKNNTKDDNGIIKGMLENSRSITEGEIKVKTYNYIISIFEDFVRRKPNDVYKYISIANYDEQKKYATIVDDFKFVNIFKHCFKLKIKDIAIKNKIMGVDDSYKLDEIIDKIKNNPNIDDYKIVMKLIKLLDYYQNHQNYLKIAVGEFEKNKENIQTKNVLFDYRADLNKNVNPNDYDNLFTEQMLLMESDEKLLYNVLNNESINIIEFKNNLKKYCKNKYDLYLILAFTKMTTVKVLDKIYKDHIDDIFNNKQEPLDEYINKLNINNFEKLDKFKNLEYDKNLTIQELTRKDLANYIFVDYDILKKQSKYNFDYRNIEDLVNDAYLVQIEDTGKIINDKFNKFKINNKNTLENKEILNNQFIINKYIKFLGTPIIVKIDDDEEIKTLKVYNIKNGKKQKKEIQIKDGMKFYVNNYRGANNWLGKFSYSSSDATWDLTIVYKDRKEEIVKVQGNELDELKHKCKNKSFRYIGDENIEINKNSDKYIGIEKLVEIYNQDKEHEIYNQDKEVLYNNNVNSIININNNQTKAKLNITDIKENNITNKKTETNSNQKQDNKKNKIYCCK